MKPAATMLQLYVPRTWSFALLPSRNIYKAKLRGARARGTGLLFGADLKKFSTSTEPFRGSRSDRETYRARRLTGPALIVDRHGRIQRDVLRGQPAVTDCSRRNFLNYLAVRGIIRPIREAAVYESGRRRATNKSYRKAGRARGTGFDSATRLRGRGRRCLLKLPLRCCSPL